MAAARTHTSSVRRLAPMRPRERELSGVKAQSLRAMNLSLVLRHILAEPGTITRANAAARTGITRATISRLVDELISSGLVEELSAASESGRGRPGIRLAPTAGRVAALGLEVNISSMEARLIDLTGAVLAHATLPIDSAGSDPFATMRTLADLGRSVLTKGLPEGALFLGSGLALPGLVSPQTLTMAPNLGWRDVPLTDLLAPLADLEPAIVANEADLAAFTVAHPRPGVPSGPASFIYVSGEVGVGAGIVVEHAPLSGARGWSGEIGHICADPHGPICSCGATGCLEAYLGRRALALRAGLDRTATPLHVLAAAAEGSATARAALDSGGRALGRALAAVINTVDIPLVVLGGNVADLAEAIIPQVEDEIATRVLQAPWSRPRIDVRSGSGDLAVTGAAHRVLQRLVDDPAPWMS